MSAERDAHFTNYARLLLDELSNVEGVFIETINDHWREEMQEIIARRAYGLACHAISFISERDLKMIRAGLWSTKQGVDQIPDMTELPEEPS
jgi:hypothetical protein